MSNAICQEIRVRPSRFFLRHRVKINKKLVKYKTFTTHSKLMGALGLFPVSVRKKLFRCNPAWWASELIWPLTGSWAIQKQHLHREDYLFLGEDPQMLHPENPWSSWQATWPMKGDFRTLVTPWAFPPLNVSLASSCSEPSLGEGFQFRGKAA